MPLYILSRFHCRTMGRFSIHTSLCNVYKFNSILRASWPSSFPENVRISVVPKYLCPVFRGFPAAKLSQMQNKMDENDHSQMFCLLLSKIQRNTTSMLENQCPHLQHMQWLWPTHEDLQIFAYSLLMQIKSYPSHPWSMQSYCVHKFSYRNAVRFYLYSDCFLKLHNIY